MKNIEGRIATLMQNNQKLDDEAQKESGYEAISALRDAFVEKRAEHKEKLEAANAKK